MNTAILLIIALIGLLLVLRVLLTAPPAVLARRLKMLGGLGLLGIAAALAVTGRWAYALPVGVFGLSLLNFGRLGGFSPVGHGPRGPGPGRQSTVRSAALEMNLDHSTGDMSGHVLAGSFTGQSLDELSDQQLLSLREEMLSDAESQALLEAYLDRRMPRWRENVEQDGTAGQTGPAGSGAMTDEEAYEVLGLGPEASVDDIRDAHRRLMKRLHPDHGGSDFLAAKINQAKDRLLGHRRSSDTHY